MKMLSRRLTLQLVIITLITAMSAERENNMLSLYYQNDSCFSHALFKSQSCGNFNIQFTTLMGYAGLGSEFEWLMTSLLYAVMHQRRLVYLETPYIPWKYNCPEKKGWACFLSRKRCPTDIGPTVLPSTLAALNLQKDLSRNNTDSILLRKGRKDFVVMNSNNAWMRHAIFQYSWSGQVYGPSLAGKGVLNEARPSPDSAKALYLRSMFERKMPPNETLLQRYGLTTRGSCSGTLSVSDFDSIASRFLYQLSGETQTAVQEINAALHPTLTSPSSSSHPLPYSSLQIRLTDKEKELLPEVWQWMINISNIAEMIVSYLLEPPDSLEINIHHLFVAADSCRAVSELRHQLPYTITIHSSCGRNWPYHYRPSSESNKDGTQRDHAGGLKLLADIEMLRGGRQLFGLEESNVVRLARRLQAPESLFHPLGPRRG